MDNKPESGKQHPNQQKPQRLGYRRKSGALPDMEWLEKSRDDVPAVNRSGPRKTPLLDLLKPGKPSEKPLPKTPDNKGDNGHDKS